METQNFQKLIQAITGRDFIISTKDSSLILNKKYYIYKVLPISKRKIGFDWITPGNEENILKSFLTAFSNKYYEPNPLVYNGTYGAKWDDLSPDQKEFAYYHHRSRMYGKKDLMNQIQLNFDNTKIFDAIIRYGFYPTEYGIGIFVFWTSKYVENAVQKMREYLRSNNIPFTNELSNAKWVLRFKINIGKENHYKLLKSF
jgi:hypothetical protein